MKRDNNSILLENIEYMYGNVSLYSMMMYNYYTLIKKVFKNRNVNYCNMIIILYKYVSKYHTVSINQHDYSIHQ